MRHGLRTAILIIALMVATACSLTRTDFHIISGSENTALEPILKEFGRKHGANVIMHYKGSVDIMLDLQKETLEADAVWPANSLWIALGDERRRIKHVKSIMTSPVVFGIRKSKAESLGLVGRKVGVSDILSIIQAKQLTFMMTSATQSNSGASAYFGFLYALSGNPDILTAAHLGSPELKKKMRALLAGINRSSESSGWLKDLFLQGGYDAMVNYEALIIETNQELERQGKEPLYAVYPSDGIVLSDSPLGYVNRNDRKKEDLFLKLQNYLLSDAVQSEILNAGRRTGFGGLAGAADKKIFNPAWGIDYDRILSPIKLPPVETIRQALMLYQTELKKPSFTVFCLDYSGSMAGEGEKAMKDAMRLLLDRDQARQYMIDTGSDDVSHVLAFSDRILNRWSVSGNDPAALTRLAGNISAQAPQGYTDIYSPVLEGLRKVMAVNREEYIPAIILLTDGESNTGSSYAEVKRFIEANHLDVPVFSIMFGGASEEQLKALADLTRGRVFDGRTDLVKAFRKAKGYN
jgi:Ca-activated chloride channel homolog